VYPSISLVGAVGASLPVLTGIADYIQAQPYLFGVQLAGTILVAALCLRFAHSLQHVTTESLGGRAGDGWSKLLGRVAYMSLLGFGLTLVVGIWAIGSYQRALVDQLAQQAPILIRNSALTLLVLALMLGVGRMMQRASIRRLAHGKLDINLSVLVSRFIYLCALGVGILIVLAIWDVQLVIPVTALGAVTVALTLSLQGILQNLVAGVYLLVERPFRIGDEIAIDKYTGEVEDIHMRVTTLRTKGGEQVLIPNSIIFGSAVTNNTAYRRRRALLTVVLPADMDAEAGEAAILEVLKTVDGILADPPPDVTVNSLIDQKLTLAVYLWVPSDRLDVLSAALFHVKRALPAAEVSIPGVAGVA